MKIMIAKADYHSPTYSNNRIYLSKEDYEPEEKFKELCKGQYLYKYDGKYHDRYEEDIIKMIEDGRNLTRWPDAICISEMME